MNKYYKTLELHKVLKCLPIWRLMKKLNKWRWSWSRVRNMIRCAVRLIKLLQSFDLAVRFGTPPFYNVKDVNASLRRAASGSRISLKELLEIKSILGQITALSDWYSHCENIQTDLDYLFSSLRPNKYLYEKLDRSIISEDEISDAASPELAAIRKKN